jgi:hypothetical protein
VDVKANCDYKVLYGLSVLNYEIVVLDPEHRTQNNSPVTSTSTAQMLVLVLVCCWGAWVVANRRSQIAAPLTKNGGLRQLLALEQPQPGGRTPVLSALEKHRPGGKKFVFSMHFFLTALGL